MLGVAGDAILIMVGVPLLALVTYPVWAPALARFVNDVRRGIRETNDRISS